MMELAIIAARVSTKDQSDRGYSLPQQIDAGLKYVVDRSYRLADCPGYASNPDDARLGVFQEDYTGMSMDRPALDAMREAVKQYGVKVIVFTELDRLARRAIYQTLLEEEFTKLGARVEYVYERFDDSDEGRLFKGIKKELAEYERVKILRRMRNGKAGRVKSGKVLISDRAPYGYRRSPDGTTLVVCEEEARIIVLIFGWYIDGLSPRTIADRLNAMHVPTYAGPVSQRNQRGWSPASIIGVLANETLTGVWHYNKHHIIEKKPGQPGKKTLRPREEWMSVEVPLIIDDRTFALVRARAERNKVNASRNRKRLYLFSGMLKCDACGWSYSGTTIHQQWHSYRCGGTMERNQHGNRLCNMPYYSEADLDAEIWPWLTDILKQPEKALKAMQQKAEGQQGQLERLQDRLVHIETQLADVRRRIANLNDQLETEADEENRKELAERKAQRFKTRRELEAEHASVMAKLEQQPLSAGRMEHVAETCAWIARKADEATPEKKRQVYELAHLTAWLAVENGYKVAHVSCIVGDKTVQVGIIANGASRRSTPPSRRPKSARQSSSPHSNG
jgi:site-specific DNA recombinase